MSTHIFLHIKVVPPDRPFLFCVGSMALRYVAGGDRSRSPPKSEPQHGDSPETVAVVACDNGYVKEEWQDSQPDPCTLPDYDLDLHLKIDRYVTYHEARTAGLGVAGLIADGVQRIRREHAAAK